MHARLTLSTLVAVAAALSLTLSAGAANNRPGDYYNGKPATAGWTAVHPNPTGSRTINPNPDKWGSKWGSLRPNATAGWTRAAA